MQPGSQEEVDRASTGDVDLSRIVQLLLKKRWWVLAPTLAALIGATIFVNVVKPRYAAEARLLLENQENFLARAEKNERAESTTAPDAEAVQSQIQLLTSRDLARRAIKTLELQGNTEFDPLAKGIGPLTRVLVLLGIARDPTRLSPEDRILETFGDKLAVLSPTKTRVLSVEFSSRDPDLAARGANVVAETYLEMQQDAKRTNARAAAKALGSLVADLKTKVSAAEEEVEAFRLKSGLLIGANNAIITTQQLGELNNQLSTSRASQADAQAKAKVLREMIRQNRVGEIPDVANNEVIRRITEQRVTLRAQLALESRTLLPEHPRIKELTAQLSDLDQQLRIVAERTARTLENEARIAGNRVENLARALDDQKKVAGTAGSEEVHLRDLERAARLLKDQLEAETMKYQEAVARESVKSTPADARIIQRALAPQRPAFPKKIPITAFATLAALILSVGTIVAGELLTGRARVEPRVAFPFVAPLAAPAAAAVAAGAPIPETPLVAPPGGDQQSKPDALAPPDVERSATRSVKVLIAGADARIGRQGGVALSRALARKGSAVLVAADAGDASYDALVAAVDAAKPSGLSDLMSGAAEFSGVIHRDAQSPLHVTPAGAAVEATRYDFPTVIDAYAGAYDFVVVATSQAETARRLAPLFDMALVSGSDETAEVLRGDLARAGVPASLLEDADSALEAAAA